MKKYLALIMAVLALFAMMATVCSCGDGGASDGTTAPDVTTDKPDVTTTSPDVTTAEPDETTAPDNNITYTIKVVDQNGAPVEGVIVKLCEGEVCRKPVITGADGTAAYKFEPNGNELKAMIEVEQDEAVSAAYTYSSEYVHLEAGATEVTLTVTAK